METLVLQIFPAKVSWHLSSGPEPLPKHRSGGEGGDLLELGAAPGAAACHVHCAPDPAPALVGSV